MGAPASASSVGSTMDQATLQQNLSRAFIQSAVAQNMQMQQQLMAQNQALQQLLNTVINARRFLLTISVHTHFDNFV